MEWNKAQSRENDNNESNNSNNKESIFVHWFVWYVSPQVFYKWKSIPEATIS